MQQILLREEIETLRSEIDHQERTMTSEQMLLNTVAVIFLPEIRDIRKIEKNKNQYNPERAIKDE